jgi:hypothetical protein
MDPEPTPPSEVSVPVENLKAPPPPPAPAAVAAAAIPSHGAGEEAAASSEEDDVSISSRTEAGSVVSESSSQEPLDFDRDPDLMTMIMEARIFFLPHDTTRRMGTNWLYTRLGWKQKCMGIEISTRS